MGFFKWHYLRSPAGWLQRVSCSVVASGMCNLGRLHKYGVCPVSYEKYFKCDLCVEVTIIFSHDKNIKHLNSVYFKLLFWVTESC